MNETSGKYLTICIYVILALSTLAVFWQLRTHDFVHYDDHTYVSENPHVKAGLAGKSIVWAFTTGRASNFHPLTWLSHMLDVQLFGINPGWHHMTNLLLHIANTLLLFAILKRMTAALWPSAFVAAAFALHPLHVESMAWIAERKDVLSTLFWFLTMGAYLRYVEHPDKVRYRLTVFSFALGLMAKPMLVTLPFVLLLLDFWPLGRVQFGRTAEGTNRRSFYRLIWEKAPFFVLSAISSVITFLVQRSGGAVVEIGEIALRFRIANAFLSYLRYIGKMLWPARLAVFYPHPGENLAMWQVAVAVLVLIGLTVWVIRLAPRHKYLPVGWFWYAGALVPVIGLVQVGEQAMADRYSYIPLTGLFIIIAWGLPQLLAKWRYRKATLGISAVVVLLCLSVCTRLQMRHWRNGLTLFEHALEVNPNDSIIHNNIGLALQSRGRFNEAIGHYRQALLIKPDHAASHSNLAGVLVVQGKLDEAVSHYGRALQSRPRFAKVHYNLGKVLHLQGRFDEAASCYRQARHLDPDIPEAHSNLAIILALQGKSGEAIHCYRQALRANPYFAEAHNNLANELKRKGEFDEALSHYRQALRLTPHLAETHNNLAALLESQGKFREALSHSRQALRIKPDWPEPMNAAARILAMHPDPSLRNADEAIELAERAAKLTEYKDASILSTLAAGYASASRFDEAVSTAEKALAIVSTPEAGGLADYIRSQLQLYRQGKPPWN